MKREKLWWNGQSYDEMYESIKVNSIKIQSLKYIKALKNYLCPGRKVTYISRTIDICLRRRRSQSIVRSIVNSIKEQRLKS